MKNPIDPFKIFFTFAKLTSAAIVGVSVAGVGCSSSSNNGSGIASCNSPGAAQAGPADTHCEGQAPVVVSAASCAGGSTDDAGSSDDAGSDDAGVAAQCDYGATMANQEGDDDDCKYHVKWSSTPICEGAGGVTFTVTVTTLADGKPVTAIPQGVIIETFQPTSPTQACDDVSTHPGPNTGAYLTETASGTGVYQGPVVFDAPGIWTVRFHIHEECADTLDDSPHGHAAFHINVP